MMGFDLVLIGFFVGVGFAVGIIGIVSTVQVLNESFAFIKAKAKIVAEKVVGTWKKITKRT